MDPLRTGSSSHSESFTPRVDTGRKTQESLEESPRPAGRYQFNAPLWAARAKAAGRIVGLSLGTVLLGAISLGLLPLTLPGVLLYKSAEHSKGDPRDQASKFFWGALLGAPVAGMELCIDGIVKEIKGKPSN